MVVKARAQVTVTRVADVASTARYYKLQSSTLAKPAKPTAKPPVGWATTEPTYTAGATNSLYTCDLTVFSDDTFTYSDVSLSSSYEAAKDAYNKAIAAAKTATDYMDFGADGLVIGDMTSGTLAGNVSIKSDGVELRDGTSVLARLKAGVLELAANSANAIIKLCGGKGTIAYYAATNQLAIMAPGSIAMTACQTLPDGTVQPYDAGVACNKYGVIAKGVIELSGSMRVNGSEGALGDWIVSREEAGEWSRTDYASGKRVLNFHGYRSMGGNLNPTGGFYVSNQIVVDVPAAFRVSELESCIISADNDSLGIIGKTSTASRIAFRAMSWYNTGNISALFDVEIKGKR